MYLSLKNCNTICKKKKKRKKRNKNYKKKQKKKEYYESLTKSKIKVHLPEH